VALPVLAWRGRFRWAAGLSALILAECAILAINHFHCPLTNLAARYTAERTANFDIFLPEWLARHNQSVFGALFVAGGLFTLWRWRVART